MTQDGALRTLARVERSTLPATAGQDARPVEIDMRWTVDTATGLVVREQRQTWIAASDGNPRTLVEERERAIVPGEN